MLNSQSGFKVLLLPILVLDGSKALHRAFRKVFVDQNPGQGCPDIRART